MSIHDLLARIDSATSSSLVAHRTHCEGTAKTQEAQGGSPSSSGYLKDNQPKYNSVVKDVQIIKTICKCGYRPPFCACGFYTFPQS